MCRALVSILPNTILGLTQPYILLQLTVKITQLKTSKISYTFNFDLALCYVYIHYKCSRRRKCYRILRVGIHVSW